MDERTFGELSKQVARAETRRGALGVLAGAVGAGIVAVVGRTAPAAAQDVDAELFGFCRAPKRKCGRDRQCCSGRCRSGRCTCRKNGAPCIAAAVCCARRCTGGTCG